MKKILTVLVIASALTSCGGGSSNAAKADSVITSVADSAKKDVDTMALKVDSTVKAAADTVKVKVNAIVDSAKKAVKK